MQETTTCSHDELEERLHAAGAESGAAEAHGLLSGITCAGGAISNDTWLGHLLGEDNTLSVAAQDCNELLTGMQTDILRQFNDDDFGFELALPGDEQPLSTRIHALADWCAGFLYGLALGGVREDAALPDNVREAMKDFYEISNARFAYESTDEADEAAYMEIVEYVRMSVLLMHEELQPLPAAARLQ